MNDLKRSDDEQALVDLAAQVLPAGGFGNLASNIVIKEGRGGRVWDVSGNEYVDFLLGSGPRMSMSMSASGCVLIEPAGTVTVWPSGRLKTMGSSTRSGAASSAVQSSSL